VSGGCVEVEVITEAASRRNREGRARSGVMVEIGAVLLAAGASQRFGVENMLLANIWAGRSYAGWLRKSCTAVLKPSL
jgi:hypothetical protein